MPPEPEPSRFSDWSSLGSPPTRTSPHSVPGVQTEQSDNAQNQLNVSTTGEIRTERVEVSNSEGVNISPHTEQSRENQDIPARPAPLNIEVGMQRNNIESNLVEVWYSLEQYIGLKEDKLSSTTVDFIRSEGNLETKRLYWFSKPKMC